MQSIGGFNMDPDLVASRKKVREIIFQSIMNGRFPNQSQRTEAWKPKAADITKKLEELLFKDAVSKEDYMSMTAPRIEQQLFNIMKNMRSNNQQSSHRISSSSSMNTMMPTPGIAHNGSGLHSIVSADNLTINNTNVASSMVQNTNANVSVGAANNSIFTGNGTNNLHGYRQTPVNTIHGTGGSNNVMQRTGISHELSQMIPTPGLSSNNNNSNNNFNSQPMPSNSELSSHGQSGGLSGIDTIMVPQQQKQQSYVSSQNSRMLQGFGGQSGAAVRSNMQQNIPTFGLSNVVSSGSSIGLTGSSSSMPSTNRFQSQDVYPNNASYATSNRQQHQQNMQLPSSQHQLLPMAGQGYSGSNMYGSGPSFVSTLNNSQRINSMNMHAKPKTSHALTTHHNSSMQQQQQQPSSIKPHSFDSSQQQMNLPVSQAPQEYQMHPQNQMHNAQHQPLETTNHERSVQKQQQQHVQNQHQLIPKTEILRQNSTANFAGQSVQDHNHQSVESSKKSLVSHPLQQHHMSGSENQYQHINNNDDSIGTSLFKDNTQFLSQFPGSQDFQTSYSHGLPVLHEQPLAIESQNEFSSLLNAPQSDAFHQQNWHPQMRQQNDSTGDSNNIFCDQQQQFHVANNEHIEVQKQQQSHVSFDVAHVSASQTVAVPPHSSGGHEDLKWTKQIKWLLLLLHSHKCPGSCKFSQCMKIHELCLHMEKCKPEQQCKIPRCIESKALINHFTHCSLEACTVCVPVKKFAALHRKAIDIKKTESWKPVSVEITTTGRNNTLTIEPNSIDAPQPSPKRMKTQQSLPSLVPKQETSPIHLPYMNIQSNTSLDNKILVPQQSGLIPHIKPEPSVIVKTNPLSGGLHTNFSDQIKKDNSTNPKIMQIRQAVTAEPLLVTYELDGHDNQEIFTAEKDKNKLIKVETKQEANVSHSNSVSGSKSGKPTVKGVSMTELFTLEQINDHIISLRKWVGQSKAKAEKNQALERSMTENSCQLCAAEKLSFDPPPIYCTPCGARIKRNAMYYTFGSGDTRHYFCIACYNEARGDSIQVDGSVYPKSRLDKKKNDEETEESWVQCDKCEAWQHQICALFNGRRNDGGQAEYTCPNCYVLEVKNGERTPLPQSAVLGAKDLPRTILSDHIEQRLFRRLKQEKQERARHFGKSIDEIPGADSLVVRVVSSVDKKLEVKQRFLEIFQEENYPAEFPYKSKVVLLFQNIEGVEVCLFGMYVQEFGSECQLPNQRRVYLSYLDSVKYFRPDIKTVTGEALRTFVYHEILIAYLEYCKKRGFTSCYIWACPPLKGEDYILYCHPEIQKTPKSDKLREWYLAMLRKAAKENIVVELTNLYDHFFTTTGECKAKVTAARLPYFDGDYWPGAAEDMINQLRLEEDGRKLQKGKTKKLITKRALKAAGQIDISGNASKDALLMQKLGETIYAMKEDFIMVHLQHSCTHCCLLMVSGTRWVCNKCKNFQLCEKCYDAEQRLDVRERHPVNSREKHDLFPVKITDVSSDTKDKDEILESEFFDTRQAFLSLCQGNHYQYDTLRRAKHSSMMVLYHLHNPTAPAFVTTCNVCHHDVEAGQGWRCEICPDFDVCNACYKKDGGVDHPHKLTNYPTTSERDAQNQEARQKRVVQLRKMLDLLVHASQCRYPSCQYPNCRKVKGLFRHGIQCKTRATGGCLLCKKMWYLLQLHARACKESECHVPRCKDLKDHLKRLQQQSDSRRRAAVMEMMRQRHAEVAGGND